MRESFKQKKNKRLEMFFPVETMLLLSLIVCVCVSVCLVTDSGCKI